MHVTGNRGWHDIGRVAVPNVEHVMRLELMRADDPTLQRHMVTQQGVGDDPFTTTEILTRMPRLDGRSLHAELLTIDAAVECSTKVEGIVREDGQVGNAIADPVVGRLQRCLAQILLVGRLQHVVGNITGARHDEVAVVHRLGDDTGHQTVRIGDLLDVARLQRCQRRQELALPVHKAEHVTDIAERQLIIEAVLFGGIVVGLGSAPGQRLALAIVVEMLQLPLAQLTVERQPLFVEFGLQRVKLRSDGLAQPGNVHLAEHAGLLLKGDQLVSKAAVLQTVVQIDLSSLEAFSELAVKPELIAVGM